MFEPMLNEYSFLMQHQKAGVMEALMLLKRAD